MLTVREAAARAGVCEAVVRGWVKSGRLPHYRLGLKRGKIAIAAEDLDALVRGSRVERREPGKAPARKAALPVPLRHLRQPS